MRRDAAPVRRPAGMTLRRVGWLGVIVVAALLLGVAPGVSTIWAFATEGPGRLPLLVALVPQGLLAFWVVGGSWRRFRTAA